RRVAAWQETLAREQVAAAAALAYLEADRAKRFVATTEADLNLATSLLKLARDQRSNGLATGVDVPRLQTRQGGQSVGVIQAQVRALQTEIRRKRVSGLPLGTSFQLVAVANAPVQLPSTEQSIDLAEEQRAEVKIASETLTAANDLLGAAKAGHYPTIDGH